MPKKGCCPKINPILDGALNLAFNRKVELGKERMKFCRPCENNILGVCKLCICVVKMKTRVPEMFCPDTPSKWGAVNE